MPPWHPCANLQAVSLQVPDAAETLRAEFCLAAGTWETIAQREAGPHAQAVAGDGLRMMTSAPVEKADGSVVIDVAYTGKLGYRAMRIIAVDANGQEYAPSDTSSVNAFAVGMSQVTATFQKLPLTQIKQFRLQIRPYQCVLFRRVALHRGQKTDVQIEFGFGMTPPFAIGLSTSPLPAMEAPPAGGSEPSPYPSWDEKRSWPNWYSAGPGWRELDAIALSHKAWVLAFSHSAKHYQTILSLSQPGSLIVLTFALDNPDREVPAEYKDLLPMPWPEIEAALKKGETVKHSASARQRRIVLLAAPTERQLIDLIHRTRLLSGTIGNASPGRNGEAPVGRPPAMPVPAKPKAIEGQGAAAPHDDIVVTVSENVRLRLGCVIRRANREARR